MKRYSDKQRLNWITNHAGIDMSKWVEFDCIPEWFQWHDVTLIIDAAMNQNERR